MNLHARALALFVLLATGARAQAPAPLITALTPSAGWDGDVITIDGANFSATPGDNSIEMAGLSAAVLSATATQLTVEVPNQAFSGPVVVTVNGQSSNAQPFDIALPFSFQDIGSMGYDPPTGQVWLTDRGSVRRIFRVLIDASRNATLQSPTGLNEAVGLPRDSAGRFYFVAGVVSTFNRGNIYRTDTAGPRQLWRPTANTIFTSAWPASLAINPSIPDVVFVSDRFSGAVRRVPRFGGITSYTSGLSFNYPNGSTFDTAGNLFVTADTTLYVVNPSQVRTVVATGFSMPSGIALSSDESKVFVADRGSGQVVSVDVATGGQTVVASGLSSPRAVVAGMDAGDEVLWIGETDRILRHAAASETEFQLRSIAFNHLEGDSSADAIDLRTTSGDIYRPEWHHSVIVNRELAYIQESRCSVLARIEISPPGLTSAMIEATSDDPNFPNLQPRLVQFDSNGISIGDADGRVVFDYDGDMPSGVGLHFVSFDWYQSNQDGGSTPRKKFETSGPHETYILLDDPTNPWGPSPNFEERVWVETMKLAVSATIGDTTKEAAAHHLTEFLYSAVGARYVTGDGVYGRNDGGFEAKRFVAQANVAMVGRIACYDMAKALQTFANSIGVGLQRVRVWEFGYLNCVRPAGISPTNSAFRPSPTGPNDSHWNALGLGTGRGRFSQHQFCSLSNATRRISALDLVYDAAIQRNAATPRDQCPGGPYLPLANDQLASYFDFTHDPIPCDVFNLQNDCGDERFCFSCGSLTDCRTRACFGRLQPVSADIVRGRLQLLP